MVLSAFPPPYIWLSVIMKDALYNHNINFAAIDFIMFIVSASAGWSSPRTAQLHSLKLYFDVAKSANNLSLISAPINFVPMQRVTY